MSFNNLQERGQFTDPNHCCFSFPTSAVEVEQSESEATGKLTSSMAEAEETVTAPNPVKAVKEEPDMESRIRSAMSSRVPHFKEQSDSLTFEGVRRLLEKDLGLETYALDVHKRFVKQCLLENLEGGNDANGHKISAEMGQENGGLTGEAEKLIKQHKLKKDEAELCSEDEDKMEDSPVMGLLTAKDTAKTKDAKSKHQKSKGISEAEIEKAIKKRSSYVKANSENVTMAGLRRTLEEDLKLEKHALDPYKVFISKKLDEVLKSHKDSLLENDKGKKVQKIAKGKPSKKVASKDESDSLQTEDDEEEVEADSEVEDEDEDEDEDEEKPRNKSVLKGKLKKSEVLQKRKRPEKETKISKLKKKKPATEKVSDDNISAEDSGNVSEEAASHSSAEKTVKVKEVATPYGKRVEHLKSVIKSCGMSIPPAVYRKAKQAPEGKHESQLIKELEEILAKEGLSSDPSEKEIKDVRKKKERAKELEGIDMSNIVTTTRRRSMTSFAPPPKPKIPDESDGSDSDGSGDNDEDDEDNDDNEGDEDEGNNDSHGEEAAEEDEAEDSD